MAVEALIPERLRLSPLEACVGFPWGLDPEAPPLPEPGARTSKEAIESRVIEALLRPPCHVTFSGGRDSSVILAVATRIARREGLDLPVPVSHRFPGSPKADESAWQQLVVERLGLEDWVVHEWHDELDLLGPRATNFILRHGPAFPFNIHFLEPVVEGASGGSVLTGVGGDELFTRSVRPVLAAVLYGRTRPRRATFAQLVREGAPRSVRRRAAVRDSPFHDVPWVTAAARREIVARNARDDMEVPLRWDRMIRRFWTTRYVQALRTSLHTLAASVDTQLVSPFLDPEVMTVLARRAGPLGPGLRSRAYSELGEGMLPDELLMRRTKASFNAVFFGPYSRAFVKAWDREGLDAALVDAEALASEWATDDPRANSFSLLQRAWLAATDA